MARALACLPWLPGWRHKVPRARCPPWHGRRGAPRARQQMTPQRSSWSPLCVIWTWASRLLTRGLPGPPTSPRRLTVLHGRCTAWWRQVAVPPGPPTTDTLEALRPIYAFGDLQDPADILGVIMQHAAGLGLFCAADQAGADSVVLGLERDMPSTDGLRRLPCPFFASWRRPSALGRASSCSCPWSRRVFYVARARAYVDAPRTPQQRSGDELGQRRRPMPPPATPLTSTGAPRVGGRCEAARWEPSWAGGR